MRRRLLILLIVVPLLVVIGDMVVWQITVQRLQAEFAAWAAASRTAGWSVNYGDRQAGGWPLAATLTVRDFAVQGGEADIPGGLAWQSGLLELRVALLRPASLVINARGPQHLRVSSWPDLLLHAGVLRAVISLTQNGGTQSTRITAQRVQASLSSDTAAADTMTVDRLGADIDAAPSAARGEPAIVMSLDAADIQLPSRMKWALGPRIGTLALDATLNGPLPASPSFTARAAIWRDDGGSLEIKRLDTVWGPLGLSATATLALDPQLQPMGAGNARITGYAGTADALANHGVISHSAATAAKAVLSLLAQAPDDGGPSDVEVPLSLQYRTLSMRQVPLLRLPELDWPQQ